MEKQNIKKILINSLWPFIAVIITSGLLHIHDKNIMRTFFYDTAMAAVIYALLVAIYVFVKSRLSAPKPPEQK